MCGIAGFYWKERQSAAEMGSILSRMMDTLFHRGPDSSGAWIDCENGIALGHRRLSILDLSPLGNQPMVSHCGRYRLVFNGEIYNYRLLREELEKRGHCFRGSSDTEVMIQAIVHWGPQAALEKFNGMFAFALWDSVERRLLLARDHLGIKPLYFSAGQSGVLFASELKALYAHPAFQKQINHSAVAHYLKFGYVPDPLSIFDKVKKLPPGHWVSFAEPCSMPEQVPFWSMRNIVEHSRMHPFRGSDQEALELLETKLTESIRMQMVSDVPVGSFLSGGIDSSVVTALMQRATGHAVKTFTVGFPEKEYNEADDARLVAEYLKTDHRELIVSPEDVAKYISDIAKIHDEPFSDASQIPTYLVSRLAKGEVGVTLSGDGGDEVFAGYTRYLYAERLWNVLKRLPRGLQNCAKSLFPYSLMGLLGNVEGGRIGSVRLPGPKIQKLIAALPVSNPQELYWNITSTMEPASVLSKDYCHFLSSEVPFLGMPEHIGLVPSMQYLDFMTYLPGDILTKLDRATMAVSLESRVPLLDHTIVEFAWRLPSEFKVRNGSGKRLLRQVLYKYIPAKLIDRPKMGFSVPIGKWLRDPLRKWADEILNSENRTQEGIFDRRKVRAMWATHLKGNRDMGQQVWAIILFHVWCRNNY